MNAWDWLGIALVIAGALISLTGVGAVIGIPLLLLGIIIVVLSQFTSFLVGIGQSRSSASAPGSASASNSGVLYWSR